MNLSTLTPRQWAYVLHRIEHPDAVPLDHPGNPRKQNLDRIADQLGEQLDRDELQALRDLAAGRRPRNMEDDDEGGRDLDAEPVDEAQPEAWQEVPPQPVARTRQPAQPIEAEATRQQQAPDTALDGRPAADRGGDAGAPDSANTNASDQPAPARARRGSRARSSGPERRRPVDAQAVAQLPTVHATESLQAAPPASVPAPPPAHDVLQPRLF